MATQMLFSNTTTCYYIPLLLFLAIFLTANGSTRPKLTANGAEQKTRVRLVEGQNADEGILQLFIGDQFMTVCKGNENLAVAACKWHGYLDGREVDYRPTIQTYTDNMWVLQIMCPEDAPTIDSCSMNTCSGVDEFYIRCSGFPDCTLDGGSTIPGNETAFVGRDRVCYCSKNNVVTCDCRNVAVQCSDGTRATLDNNCKPTCDVDQDCQDVQVSSLCNYYKKNGQCSNRTVQEICRNTCDLCDNIPTTAASTTTGTASTTAGSCQDQYDKQICRNWRKLGGCDRENVREVCEKSCDVCKEELQKEEEEEEECEDYYNKETCQTWKDAGHCTTSQTVKKWCSDTCGLCDRDKCQNTFSERKCLFSKKHGSCGTNLKVLKGCAETCGLCDPITQYNCRDLYKPDTCTIWAAKGVCDTNKEIHQYCASSCGVCDRFSETEEEEEEEESAAACSDISSQSLCNYYKSAGYCEGTEYKAAMESQCKFTCSLCNKTQNTCKNKISVDMCLAWKEGGYCEINTPIREELCPITCEFC